MPRLLVVCSVYNCAGGLERMLKTTRVSFPVSTQIVVVDGRYAQFPGADSGASTDGTLEVARKYADHLIEAPRGSPWPSEVAKRNAYLVGSPGDLYVMLDADEHPQGVWPGFDGENADLWLVRQDGRNIPERKYRVFRHENGLEYRHTHFGLFVGSQCRNQLPRPVLPSPVLLHEVREYTKERREARAAYYQWLREHEAPHAAWIDRTHEGSTAVGQTVKIQFLAKTRPVYRGTGLSLDHKGEVVEVPEDAARELARDFPQDFKILGTVPETPAALASPPAPERPPIIRYVDAAVVVDAASGEKIVTTLAHAASLANTAEWRLEGPLAPKVAPAATPEPPVAPSVTPAPRRGRKPVTFEPIGG